MSDSRANRPMRLALLGCGYAAELHSKTLRGMGDQIRRYYASRDAARAEEFCQRYGGDGHFGSYDQAIASPDIDVVAVLSPPAQHLDQTLAALRAGKDVIVEKPPFLRAADFDAIEAACAETGRQVFVAENYYYKPLAVKLRQLLAERVIGDVLFIHLNAIKQQDTADNWRDSAELSGGGARYEGGIHWINFLANLGLQVQAIRATQPGVAAGDRAADGSSD
ncbi:MAG: Gfo/Idh/MocA family oxidoreductase, partial [Myxococcota bacterium]